VALLVLLLASAPARLIATGTLDATRWRLLLRMAVSVVVSATGAVHMRFVVVGGHAVSLHDPRPTSSAVAGVSVGVLTIFWLALSPQLPDSMDAFRNHLHHFMTIVIGTLVILLVGLLVSRFTSRDS
jgi:hypothetical protein